MIGNIPKEKRRETSEAIIYLVWGGFKERNTRVFQNAALHPDVVGTLVKEEIAWRAYAHTQNPEDS
jgi:hypothetical protein